MKSIIPYIYFLFLTLALSGCDKEVLISEITISNHQIHFQDLNICGDEEGAVIEVQAEHFDVDEDAVLLVTEEGELIDKGNEPEINPEKENPGDDTPAE